MHFIITFNVMGWGWNSIFIIRKTQINTTLIFAVQLQVTGSNSLEIAYYQILK